MPAFTAKFNNHDFMQLNQEGIIGGTVRRSCFLDACKQCNMEIVQHLAPFVSVDVLSRGLYKARDSWECFSFLLDSGAIPDVDGMKEVFVKSTDEECASFALRMLLEQESTKPYTADQIPRMEAWRAQMLSDRKFKRVREICTWFATVYMATAVSAAAIVFGGAMYVLISARNCRGW